MFSAAVCIAFFKSVGTSATAFSISVSETFKLSKVTPSKYWVYFFTALLPFFSMSLKIDFTVSFKSAEETVWRWAKVGHSSGLGWRYGFMLFKLNWWVIVCSGR